MNSEPAILARDCIDGKRDAQEKLYRYFYPAMIRICVRYAGDMDGAGIIYNDAMLKVFKNLAAYNEQGKIEAWVKRIVVTTAIDYLRRQERFDTTELTEKQDEIDIDASAFQQLSVKEIQLVILQLPKATRTVFNLHVYEGYKHHEIADMLGISEGTSKWHVSEGRSILFQKLGKRSSI